MKVYDQTRVVKTQVDVVQHQIFNEFAEKVRARLESQVPGLELEIGGKHAYEGSISAEITGSVEDEDGQKAQIINQAVEQLRESLTRRSG